MTKASPRPGCVDLEFQGRYPIGEQAEVALEDYARALARADAAFVLLAADEPGRVIGVHVCQVGATVTPALLADLEGFARTLCAPDGPGLGWS